MIRAILIAVVVILFAACSGAQPGGTPHMYELGGETVGIWFSSGEELLPVFINEGNYYLLGIEGSRYEIGLANRTDARMEVVVSVDGRDVITGEVADYRKNRGYVVLPGEEISIEGFRRSLDEVAAFEFTTVEDSYAARLGDAANVGVIGVAIFDEKAAVPEKKIAGGPERAEEPRVPALSGAAKDAADSEQGLGTKYGENVGSTAEIVAFRRRDNDQPTELFALYYDDQAGLESIGIVLPENAPPVKKSTAPNPFPGVPDDGEGFAQPPPLK